MNAPVSPRTSPTARDTALWERVTGTPVSPAGGDFVRFAAESFGIEADVAAAELEFGLRPYVYLLAAGAGPIAPAPGVASLFDLALEAAHPAFQTLLRSVEEAPPAGGAELRERYVRCLGLYEDHFGEPPPADVWPDVECFGGCQGCKY